MITLCCCSQSNELLATMGLAARIAQFVKSLDFQSIDYRFVPRSLYGLSLQIAIVGLDHQEKN